MAVSWLSEETEPIVGATVGLVASIPVGRTRLFFEPELAFAMKGGGWSAGEGGEDKHYDYIQLPLLLRYGPRPGFFASAGLAPAVLVHEWRVSHGGVSYSKARPFDVSVVGDLGHDWEHVRLDLRVEVGLVEAERIESMAPPASKTRTLSVALGWRF
jgi:hypothetical protein